MTNRLPTYPFKAGVIGTGYIGMQHLEALQSIVADTVVCNADEAVGSAAAERFGCRFYRDYEEMLCKEKPDFVSICVPTHLHASIANAALENGINVLCEKPFTTSLADAYALVEKAADNHLTLMVAHCVRFSRPYAYLKNCLDDKRFGKLISLELFRHGPKPGWSTGGWLFDLEKSGGVTRDAHIHDTDILYYLLGKPAGVYTAGSAFCCTSLYDYGADLLVSAAASWKNASSYPFSPGYEAAFEKAVLRLSENTLLLFTNDGVIADPHEKEAFPAFMQSDDLIANEIRYFCHCLENDVPPARCLPDEVCASLAVSFSESESMKAHRYIKISR